MKTDTIITLNCNLRQSKLAIHTKQLAQYNKKVFGNIIYLLYFIYMIYLSLFDILTCYVITLFIFFLSFWNFIFATYSKRPYLMKTHTLFVLSISVELCRCSTIPEMQSGPAKPNRSAIYRKVLLRRIDPPNARYMDFQIDGDFSGSSVFCCQNWTSKETLVNQDFYMSSAMKILFRCYFFYS